MKKHLKYYYSLPLPLARQLLHLSPLLTKILNETLESMCKLVQ